MKKLAILYFTFLLLVSACVPEPIPIDLPQAESKPVIWTQVAPGNIALLYFARSFSALEYQTEDSTDGSSLISQMLTTDGLVTLTHLGNIDTLLQVTDGFFAAFNTALTPGDSYQLYARDNTSGKDVTASAIMMERVFLDSLTASRMDSATAKIQYTFLDHPGKNWYAVNFYTSFNDPLTVDDPLAAENVVETTLISDIELNEAQVSREQILEFINSDTIYVSLNNISEEYYNYLSQRERGGTIYNQLVQEPINYISNIDGGYGIFALSIPDVQMLILPQ